MPFSICCASCFLNFWFSTNAAPRHNPFKFHLTASALGLQFVLDILTYRKGLHRNKVFDATPFKYISDGLYPLFGVQLDGIDHVDYVVSQPFAFGNDIHIEYAGFVFVVLVVDVADIRRA